MRIVSPCCGASVNNTNDGKLQCSKCGLYVSYYNRSAR